MTPACAKCVKQILMRIESLQKLVTSTQFVHSRFEKSMGKILAVRFDRVVRCALEWLGRAARLTRWIVS